MAEQIIIEFISDTSGLEQSTDVLEQQGKITKKNGEEFKKTNAEILKQQKALDDIGTITKRIDDSGKVTKKNLLDLAKIIKSQSSDFQKEIKAGVIDALEKAGISAQEFGEILEDAVGPTVKQRLRELVQKLAEMKAAGEDNTELYRELAQEAGHLKDAIADANQEVKNFGSDTSTLDGVISLAGGIAGGFAAVQGAAALFGDESEELQKTLLRVNAAMAILQGLQQLQVVLQKESAAATLANTIATKVQTAAQALYNFVVGSSIGLMKAFRIALAATGVGLLVIGIIELVQALKSQNNELEESNRLLEEQKNRIEGLNEVIDQRVALQEAQARNIGAAESELIRIQGRGLQAQREGLVDANRILREQQKNISQTGKAWFELNKQIEANNDAIRGIDNNLAIKALDLEKQLADERAEALKKRIEAAKKEAEEAARLAKERRAAEFADFKAGIEVRLLAAKEGSEQELDLRKQLLRATLQIELDNDKLTLNQRRLLIQQFFKDRLDAERKFASDRENLILENIASDIQAELQTLELSQERRLELTETAINLAAELEINAAEANAAKIAEINAKRDKAIRDARIASIQEAVNYEIALATAASGPAQRQLQADIENDKILLSSRKSAIDQLAAIESSAIQKRLAALNREREEGLISQRDYNLSYQQLIDQQLKVWEDAEKKKTDLTKQESERRKQKTIEEIQLIVDAANQVVGVLDSLFQLQAEKENQDLDRRKNELKELVDAGAITEKEAIARQKRIEAEERKNRQQQAQREKTIATFNAFLAIPQAVLKGLTTGGPILAAVYGALALSQALIVASRPIPKFGKGKKNKYEGPAEVGETGAELIQSNGKMYLADKKQTVWLARDDKVFNPQETIAMLSKPKMNTERIVINKSGDKSLSIDYEKLGKAVGKHVKTDVFVDGIQAQHIEKEMMINYLNNRRN